MSGLELSGVQQAPHDHDASRPARPARVWQDLPTILGWVALVLFTLLSIGSPLRGEGTLLQTDIMAGAAPWSSTLENATADPNIMVTDTIDVITPQTLLITEAFWKGDFEEWSPYGGGGVELAGVPNSGAYSPLSLPWWVLPDTFAPGAVKLLEIVVITLGMSLFLRRLRLPQATWPLASLAYASSGFMIAWTNWPQTRVAAFIPLLFWAVDRAVTVRRLAAAVPIGLALAAMLLGGFPAVCGYALYAVGVWALVRAWTVHRAFGRAVRGLLCAGLGVVLGGLLSAWQMLPFGISTTAIVDFDARQSGPLAHLPVEALGSLLVPSLIGGPTSGFWAKHPVEALSFIGITVGLLALVALAVGPWLREHRAVLGYLVGALVVVVLLVYVGGWPLGLAQNLPVIGTSHIGRIRSVGGFFIAVLAAYGYAIVLARVHVADAAAGLRPRSPRGWVGPVLWGVVLLGLVLVVGRLAVDLWSLIPGPQRVPIRPDLVAGAVLGVLSVAILLIALRGRGHRWGMVAVALLPVLAAAQAIPVAQDWWRTSSSESFYAPTAATDFLAANLGTDRFEPVNEGIPVTGWTLKPGTNSVYRIRSLGGHNFQTSQWKDLFRAVDPDSIGSPTYTRLMAQNLATSATSPILDRMAVRYLVVSPTIAPMGMATGDGRAAGGTLDVADGGSASSSVQSGAVRGIRLTLPDAAAAALPDGVRVTVRLVAEGTQAELASTSTWLRSLPSRLPVTLAGEDIPATTAWRAEVTLTGAGHPVTLGATTSGEVDLRLYRPAQDGLRVVHTGDATIYQRTTALPRVRWANQALIVVDPAEQVAAMAAGAVPRTGVLLERAQDAAPGTSGTAEVTDLDPEGTGRQAFAVDATADGWLVVADSFRRPGWTATVDGQPTELLPAEHAAAAVRVPAGQHEVVLTYDTPGLGPGVALSLATTLGLLVGAVVWRRRGTRSETPRDGTA